MKTTKPSRADRRVWKLFWADGNGGVCGTGEAVDAAAIRRVSGSPAWKHEADALLEVVENDRRIATGDCFCRGCFILVCVKGA